MREIGNKTWVALRGLVLIGALCATTLTACTERDLGSNGAMTCEKNSKADGDETDIDCGGGCDKCADGKVCERGTDCASGTCSNNVCAATAKSCSDGVKNNTEADIDCGPGCPACADGKACVRGTDCASGSCVNNVCVARSGACSDGSKNGSETDVDCGGSDCAGCVNGKACVRGTDCASGSCVNGNCSSGNTGTSNGRIRHASKNGWTIVSHEVLEHEQNWGVRNCRLLDSSTVVECEFTSPGTVTNSNAPGFNILVRTASNGNYYAVGSARGCNDNFDSCGIVENGSTEIFTDNSRQGRKIQQNGGTGYNYTYTSPDVCLTGRNCRRL